MGLDTRRVGISTLGIVGLPSMGGGPLGLPPWDFALGDITFTAQMDKRATSVFAASPIVQGRWDGTGTPDTLTFPRDAQVGNPIQHWYRRFDPYQGEVVKWWSPERDSGSGGVGYVWYVSATYYLRYDYNAGQFTLGIGTQTMTRNVAVSAGTTYLVTAAWDCKKTIDGTNYARIGTNNAFTYGITTQPTVAAPEATCYIGSTGGASYAMAILEGLTIYRRVLFDSNGNGEAVHFNANGPIDELTAIYAAGAGADPCLVTGSWDVVFCLPTDSATGAIVTGTGEAWSHPHGSTELAVPWMEDGGYLGGDYVVAYNGTSTVGNCGSGATLDDIPAGGGIVQVECWFRCDAEATGTYTLVSKGAGGATGWGMSVISTDVVRASIDLVTADCNADSPATRTVRDGKWHHAAFSYNDATKSCQTAVDGEWGAADVGVGNYVSDAALSLYIGRLASGASWFFDGAIGWVRVWGIAHYTPGTDFVPPRAWPGVVGAVEGWQMNEGAAATSVAQVTSPANDCLLANHAWQPVWNMETSPVVPQSVEFFTENDGIDFGSGANIDDLPSADCTIEFYARIPPDGVNATRLISKSNAGPTVGWTAFSVSAGGGRLRFRMYFGTDDVLVDALSVWDGRWHHYALDWDQGTLTARLFKDGVLEGTDVAVGAYLADNAENCLVNASGAIGTYDGKFAIGSIRLSNSRRYTGNSFVPPARTNWPANDANAQLITRMNDGAGATVTDYSGNAYHGTITFGTNTRWHNTPDLEYDEPGRRVFFNGYNFGSDGCLLPDTRAFFGSGYLEVQDVVDEDAETIFQIDGQFGAVKKCWIRDYKGEVVRIKTRGMQKFGLTPEHLVLRVPKQRVDTERQWARRSVDRKPRCERLESEWVPAEQIAIGDYLLVPRPKFEEMPYRMHFGHGANKYQRRRICELFEQGLTPDDVKKLDFDITGGAIDTYYWAYKTKGEMGEDIFVNTDRELDEEWAELFGWWVAEGWIWSRNNVPSRIHFGLSLKETKEAARIKDLITKKVGSAIYMRKKDTSLEVWTHNVALAKFLAENFGCGALNKRIPEWLFNAGEDIILSFLRAYNAGDGCIKKKSRNYNHIVEMTTASSSLVSGISLLLMKVGILPQIIERPVDVMHTIRGKMFCSHASWGIRVSGKDILILYPDLPYDDGNREIYLRDGDFFYVRVSGIGREKYNGPVYDFTTDTQSLGLPVIVHNSGDGIGQPVTLTADTDYVLRAPLHWMGTQDVGTYGPWPRIQIWDVAGAAALVNFDGPPLSGQHSGGMAAADMTDANEVFPASLIGGTIYNVTDGSSSSIEGVSGTNQDTIETTLAGGAGNVWDTNDVYLIVPPDGWCWCEPIVFHPPVGHTAFDIRILERNGAGVISVHQVEIYESILANGDHESLNGGFPAAPELITGWGNSGLDAGDTEPEAVVIHAGAQSLEWNPGAINEGMTLVVAGVGAGTFFCLGGWEYGDENGYLYIGPTGANGLLQYSTVDRYVLFDNDDCWKHNAGVLRSLAANPTIGIHASSGATGDRWSDDIYMFVLDDVTLTVTPASEANSNEDNAAGVTGIRSDGHDRVIATIPAGRISAVEGWIRWTYTPRHADADVADFGFAAPRIAYFESAAADYIDVYWNAVNSITLEYVAGGGVQSGVWATGGFFTPGTDYLFEVTWHAGGMQLWVDHVIRVSVVAAVNFANLPNTANWGHDGADTTHNDYVISAP